MSVLCLFMSSICPFKAISVDGCLPTQALDIANPVENDIEPAVRGAKRDLMLFHYRFSEDVATTEGEEKGKRQSISDWIKVANQSNFDE